MRPTTLYQINNRIFSLDSVQSIDLAYPAPTTKRGMPAKPQPPSVRVVMSSGQVLEPFDGPDAETLRTYLTEGLDTDRVTARWNSPHAGLTVIRLEAVADAPARPEPEESATWNGQPITQQQAVEIFTRAGG